MFKMMIGIFSGNYEAFFEQYENCIAVLQFTIGVQVDLGFGKSLEMFVSPVIIVHLSNELSMVWQFFH